MAVLSEGLVRNIASPTPLRVRLNEPPEPIFRPMLLIMGKNVASIHVSGHRPEWRKQARPGPKERYRNEYLNSPFLLPRRYITPGPVLPRVSIERVTAYTRYPNLKSVRAATAGLPELGSHLKVANTVRSAVSGFLQSLPPAAPVVILLGEDHWTEAQLTQVLVTLHTAITARRRPTANGAAPAMKLLFELASQPPVIADTISKLKTLDYRHSIDTGSARLYPRAAGQVGKRGEVERYKIIGRYAHLEDFALGYMDPGKDCSLCQEDRESGMMQAIDKQRAGTNVTIVMCGFHHLPSLHEHLEQEGAAVLAISQVHPGADGDTEDVRRKSYVLARPDIVKYRTADELDEQAVDDVALIRAMNRTPHGPLTAIS